MHNSRASIRRKEEASMDEEVPPIKDEKKAKGGHARARGLSPTAEVRSRKRPLCLGGAETCPKLNIRAR